MTHYFLQIKKRLCNLIAQMIAMADDDLEAIRKKRMEGMMKMAEKKKEPEDGSGTVVKVYSTDTCPYCTMAKDYLDKKGVKYVDYNVNSDAEKAREMVAKTGQLGVPVLDINGKVIIGFDRRAIDEALSGG